LDTQVRRLPGSQVELTLSLTGDEVTKYFDKVYRELAQAPLRGFRPGKAPRLILRRYYGEDHIRGAAWMELLQTAVPEALEQHSELKVIGEPVYPDIEELPLEEGKPVEVSVILTVYPEATVEDLGEVKLLRPATDVEDEDVERVINDLREEHAEWVETSRAIAPGDRVTADVVIRVDGEERARQEDAVFEATEPVEGEEPRVPAGVVGHMAGQEVVVTETFDEDFEDQEMAGKTVEYVVTIKKVEEKKLPEADDDFAAEVGDFETLDELKEEIRQRLQREREKQADEALRSQAIAYLLASVDVELPEVLIAEATQRGLQELDEQLGAAGSSLQELAEAGAIDPERVESSQRERAVLGLETQLAIDALIEANELEPEEADIQAEIEELAEETHSDVKFVQQAYELQEEVADRINGRARTRRALRWIIEQAEVEDVPRDEYEEKRRELLEKLEEKRKARRQAVQERWEAELKAEEEGTEKAEGADEEAEDKAEGEEASEEEAGAAEDKGEAAEDAAEEGQADESEAEAADEAAEDEAPDSEQSDSDDDNGGDESGEGEESGDE